ncbi:MAG: HAD family hydrolase [Gemmataceae bacterium]|nr:HAD family hydrolase [Gemmataceae bacterium]
MYLVYRRPHLEAFLAGCSEHFQLAVWSSSGDGYAQAVAHAVFPAGIEPLFVWGRSRCVRRYDQELFEDCFIKDLKKVKRLGFDLRQVLIVDDTPRKVLCHYGNAIYVSPYTGQDCDEELLHLQHYLTAISQLANVRTLEKRGWRHRS